MNDTFDLTQIRGPSWVLLYDGHPISVVLPLAAYEIKDGHLMGQGRDVDLSDTRYRVWRVTSEGQNWEASLEWDLGRAPIR